MTGGNPRGGRLVLAVTADDLFADAVDHVLGAAGVEVLRVHPGSLDRAVSEASPSLVLLDTGDAPLADDAGPVTRLRRTADVPLLVLTRSTRLDDRLAAFGAGADDVVALPLPLAELRCKVEAVMRRTSRASEGIGLGDLHVDIGSHVVERNGLPIELTAMEFSLLVALGRHQRAVLSKTQLLTMVWGFDHHDVNLVEVHVSALRRKLEVAGPRIVHTVRGFGYVLRPVGGQGEVGTDAVPGIETTRFSRRQSELQHAV